MWRYLIPIGLFATVVALFSIGLDRDKETLPSPLIGKPAPHFELPSVEEPTKMVTNKSYAGRPYVVNVWATWCVGCRHEHGALMEIARRGEVPLIGVDWRDERDVALRWLSELGNPYTATAFDEQGRVAIDWGVYLAPETFLVDASGTVVHKHYGAMTMQAWEQDFLPRIRQASGPERE
jgi:cytochrome c biogenesis protein CcmG, thiol:disulfide interchange protein DsbE